MPIVCGFYLEREKTAGPGLKGLKNGETSVLYMTPGLYIETTF